MTHILSCLTRGSSGPFKGATSALASFGSEEYADYLVDAMSNSWTKNLGIEGYCGDCSGNYVSTGGKTGKGSGCQAGMMQTGQPADPLPYFSKIIDRVRERQPQVVISGEYYTSWEMLIRSHADVAGQGRSVLTLALTRMLAQTSRHILTLP